MFNRNLTIQNFNINKFEHINFKDYMLLFDGYDDLSIIEETKTNEIIRNEKKKEAAYCVGIIAYEMFGGKYDANSGFQFVNIPSFIIDFIKICCMKSGIDRITIMTAKSLLETYIDKDDDQLIKQTLFDVSPYYINHEDMIKQSFGDLKGLFRKKNTKKLFICSKGDICRSNESIENARYYIQASQCKECLPVQGFSYDGHNNFYYYERVNNIYSLKEEGTNLWNDESKYEILCKICFLIDDFISRWKIKNIYDISIITRDDKEIIFLFKFEENPSKYFNDYDKKGIIDSFGEIIDSKSVCLPKRIKILLKLMKKTSIQNSDR